MPPTVNDDQLSRVRITYRDGANMRELPFIVGVIADLSGQPEVPLPNLLGRRFMSIDRNNFDTVLTGCNPRLKFRIDNVLDSAPLDVELKFETMEDFEPHRVAQQVEPLRRLLARRDAFPDQAAGCDRIIAQQLDKVLHAPESSR